MITYLLDTNLLIALAWPQHIHHAPAHRWFNSTGNEAWATCPMTQLGFIRISSNSKIIPAAVRPQDAVSLLRRILQLPGHHFWPDDVETVSSEEFSSIALTGHRQVTDAHLLALSKRHDGKLATFDRGISTLLGSSKPVDRHIELIDVR